MAFYFSLSCPLQKRAGFHAEMSSGFCGRQPYRLSFHKDQGQRGVSWLGVVTNVTEPDTHRMLDFRAMNDTEFNGIMDLLHRLQSEVPSDDTRCKRMLTRIRLNVTMMSNGSSDRPSFHVNASGFRLVLGEGWLLYVVNTNTNLMHVYDTESWGEWIRRVGTRIDEMFLYSDKRKPRLLLTDKGDVVTLEIFMREVEKYIEKGHLLRDCG